MHFASQLKTLVEETVTIIAYTVSIFGLIAPLITAHRRIFVKGTRNCSCKFQRSSDEKIIMKVQMIAKNKAK